MRIKRGLVTVGVLAVSSTACMATRTDIEQLRDEINTVRAESASADSLRALQLVQVLRAVREMNDTLFTLATRINRVRAESEGTLREVRRGIVQMQDMAGQSQQRLQEMKATLEERSRMPVVSPSPGDTTRPRADSAVVDSGPGPNQLFRIGRDQLTRGANSSARAAFADLLSKYPQSELAPDAQFYLAEAYAAEGKNAAADSAYAAVVTHYPTSPRAPTALYKRGVAAQRAGRATTARRLFNDVIKQFPESDEAELARERLRAMS